MEAILFVAERRRQTEDGAVKLLVDPARVRRVLSDSGHSGGRLDAWVDEIMGANIRIQTPLIDVTGHLIDEVTRTRDLTRPNHLGLAWARARAKLDQSVASDTEPTENAPPKERSLWTVRLGRVLLLLLENDLALHYDPAPIARLRYGVSQAIARHVLTHRQQPFGGWILDTLIRTVGAVSDEDDAATIRNRRREVRADAKGLSAIGIVVKGDRVHRDGM